VNQGISGARSSSTEGVSALARAKQVGSQRVKGSKGTAIRGARNALQPRNLHGGARKAIISGAPNHNHVSTSYAERQNLTMRMSMRRFTRLTNGFSKKLENHEHALALYFMYYNFCRIHQSLRVTPAMEAGVTDHVWEIREVVALID